MANQKENEAALARAERELAAGREELEAMRGQLATVQAEVAKLEAERVGDLQKASLADLLKTAIGRTKVVQDLEGLHAAESELRRRISRQEPVVRELEGRWKSLRFTTEQIGLDDLAVKILDGSLATLIQDLVTYRREAERIYDETGITTDQYFSSGLLENLRHRDETARNEIGKRHPELLSGK